MSANGQQVIQWMESLAPKHYAMAEDKIGLQLGSLNKPVDKVLVALDVNAEVVEEAIQLQADLIIAHHAIIYRPIKQLVTDTPMGRLYERLIKHDIAVYIAHTNLDVAAGGINDLLAAAIGLEQLTFLDEIYSEKLNKLVVYVPEAAQQSVREALFHAGAGYTGQYSHCSFNTAGTGSFMPSEGTSPFIGSAGKLSQVEEVRIETIVPAGLLRTVIQAMLKAHPYEEAAYDVFPLVQNGQAHGIGRIGKLKQPVMLEQLVETVKRAYDVPFVRIVGDPQRTVSKVAVLGGAGRDYVRHAVFQGADTLITGDIDYHTAQDALAAGLSIIDAGHNIEKLMKVPVADYLQRKANEHKKTIEFVASHINTEVFRFM